MCAAPSKITWRFAELLCDALARLACNCLAPPSVDNRAADNKNCNFFFCTASGTSEQISSDQDGGVGEENYELPLGCNSPGWRETPRDVTLLPGRHVFMNCRSTITHSRVVWVLDGMVDITTVAGVSERVRLFNGNHSLRLGPLEAEDGEMVLGCRIHSLDYGVLPSPLATIAALSESLTTCVVNKPHCAICRHAQWFERGSNVYSMRLPNKILL